MAARFTESYQQHQDNAPKCCLNDCSMTARLYGSGKPTQYMTTHRQVIRQKDVASVEELDQHAWYVPRHAVINPNKNSNI